jgi:predicted MFS family arabinose efflux permease
MTAVAGPLAALDLFYPFVATAAVNLLAGAVVYTFPDTGDVESEDPFTLSDAVSVVRDELSKPRLRTFVLYTVLFYATIAGVFLFIQPASLAVGIEVEQVGLVYSGFAVVSAVAGYFAGDIADAVGLRTWIHAAPPVLGVVFMLVGVLPVAAIPAFFFMKIAGEVTGPVRGQYLNDNTQSVGRATVLSAVSMVSSLVLIPINSFAGALGDLVGPTDGIAILGVVLFVGTVGMLLLDTPVKTTETNPTPTGD